MINLLKNYLKVFAVFFLAVSIFFTAAGFLFFNYAQAGEDDPLDYLNGVKKFEVLVGVDKELGRYFTYHYEFEN
jgi:hypothetical protein